MTPPKTPSTTEPRLKAVALMSGGLDSTLAVQLMKEQGIEVEALNFHTGFCSCGDKADAACKPGVDAAAVQLGVPLKKINVAQEYIKEVVINPRHGYGSQMNPCMDCRAFMLIKAKEHMKKTGASFLISGEVLGQRPMSQQRHQMKVIEKHAQVEGLVVRPLSAQALEPSEAEQKGWVDRSRLKEITGRSRKPQRQLAADFNILEYENAAGGCLLTDAGFSRRLKDLFAHDGKEALNVREVMMMRLGRHFRLTPYHRLIVGRNQNDNHKLGLFRAKSETLFDAAPVPGPRALLKGPVPSCSEAGFAEHEVVKLAASVVARYSDHPRDQALSIGVTQEGGTARVDVAAMDETQLAGFRV